MPRSELVALYGGKGIAADRLTITYRCIGVRSARAWIVLAELLGHPCERIDDGP